MAIDVLPQMTESKKKIDMHVKIASKILSEIKSRQIDKLQDIEDEILQSKKVSGENRQDLENLLGIEVPNSHLLENKQQFMDKVRLLIIMILCLKDMDLLEQMMQKVMQIHSDPQEVETLQKVKKMFIKRQVSCY